MIVNVSLSFSRALTSNRKDLSVAVSLIYCNFVSNGVLDLFPSLHLLLSTLPLYRLRYIVEFKRNQNITLINLD